MGSTPYLYSINAFWFYLVLPSAESRGFGFTWFYRGLISVKLAGRGSPDPAYNEKSKV